MPKNCNFQPYELPSPSPKLHQDAKKKLQKMQLLAKTENAKKCKKKCKLYFLTPCLKSS